MSDYAHRMMADWSPNQTAFFSDLADYQMELAHRNTEAMQEAAAITPTPWYQLRRRLADWIDPGMPF